MRIYPLIARIAVCSLIAFTGPAPAGNDKTPPGNPCAKGNGNPCNGNNGNLGRQGNSGHHKPPVELIPLPMPAVSGRGAFVTQVGEANVSTIMQSAPDAYAMTIQAGSDNEADVTQRGSGSGYVLSKQAGTANFARVAQDGSGRNVAYVIQFGTSNWIWSQQNAAGAAHNGAILTQIGSNNDISLIQNGSDNRALLTQLGEDNGMTAVQNGVGNRLIWTQSGSNLADLGITQSGAQTIQITQTGPGH
jgi:hypothetical protein